MAFSGVQFPTSRPQMHQANIIQQQAPQESGGGGGLLGSLFGMGLNMLMPGMGSLATGLINGSPQQALGGVAQMAGLDTGGVGNSPIPGGNNTSTPQQPQGTASPKKENGEQSDTSSGTGTPSAEPQKIENTSDSQNQQNNSIVDPSQQLQQLLAMFAMQQMFQSMNPSLFPMPHNPVAGINPAARSPITGGMVM